VDEAFVGEEHGKNMLFSLRNVVYTPQSPRKDEPFTVKGSVELFNVPFIAPMWALVTVTYPERWWEEIIPIIGGPKVTESTMILGGDFEVTFAKGFTREGEYTLEVEVYSGPTYAIDKVRLPPLPSVASERTTFIVSGEAPSKAVTVQSLYLS